MTLVDSDSFYVSGYFEETKPGHIHEGQHATIRLMGQARVLDGHVVGVSAAITSSERNTATGPLLHDVKPPFRCARLAQRVPVRSPIYCVPKCAIVAASHHTP